MTERRMRRVSGVWFAVCISRLYQLLRSVDFDNNLCICRICVSVLYFNEVLRNYQAKGLIFQPVLLKSEGHPMH